MIGKYVYLIIYYCLAFYTFIIYHHLLALDLILVFTLHIPALDHPNKIYYGHPSPCQHFQILERRAFPSKILLRKFV